MLVCLQSSSAAVHEAADRQKSGSLASVSIPGGSELSTTSQGSGKQHSLPAPAPSTSAGAAVTAGEVAAAGAASSPTEAPSQASAAPVVLSLAPLQQLQQAFQAVTPRSEVAGTPGPTPAAAPAAAAAGPASPQHVVPAVVRLVSHKVSKRQYEAVVLAQVLEGSAGVVWVVAASPEGAFLATAGQDCVLRVWQLTASRYVASHVRKHRMVSCGGAQFRFESQL